MWQAATGRGRWVLVGAALLLAALASAQRLQGGAQEGLPCPAISAAPVNGPAITLKKLIAGNGAIVALADARVREGQRLLVYLQQQQAELRKQQLGVLAIALGYSQRSSVEKLAKESELSIPLAHDAGGQWARAFGVAGSAAAIFVVDREGKVRKRLEAGQDAVDLGPPAMEAARKMIEEAAQAKPEEPDKGKPKADAPPAPVAPAPGVSEAEARERIRGGLLLLQKGFTAAAAEDARLLAKARPTDPLVALWLGYALEAVGHFPEAAVAYRRLLALAPGHLYASQAIQRIDPAGRWKSPADLPEPPKPAAPNAPTTGAGGGTSAQGSAIVG
jgi:peroxiredoxin